MDFTEIIGIDISKDTLDAHIHATGVHAIFQNKPSGFRRLLKWVTKNVAGEKEDHLFAFEHTGLYSYKLALFLETEGIAFYMFSGLEVKRSMGIRRGKDDKRDAGSIALLAHRLRDEIRPTQLAPKKVESLKRLLGLRRRLVTQRAGFKASLGEYKRVLDKKDNKALFLAQQRMVAYLTKQIINLEDEIDSIVRTSISIEKNLALITSIKGVGRQTALMIIVATHNFTRFDNWRKFSAYCGTAPFPNSSGTSLRGRSKVSHLADKKMKSLLDMCAKSALQYNPEMKEYYQRRLQQGKGKMSTVNIVRNKILSRIFAVVNRQTPYANTMKYAA